MLLARIRTAFATRWQLLVMQALGGVTPALSALLAGFTRAGMEGAVYGLDNAIDSGARSLAPLLGAGIAFWLELRAPCAATGLLFLLMVALAARLPKPDLE